MVRTRKKEENSHLTFGYIERRLSSWQRDIDLRLKEREMKTREIQDHLLSYLMLGFLFRRLVLYWMPSEAKT
jgi:predicted acetyltransferase